MSADMCICIDVDARRYDAAKGVINDEWRERNGILEGFAVTMNCLAAPTFVAVIVEMVLLLVMVCRYYMKTSYNNAIIDSRKIVNLIL